MSTPIVPTGAVGNSRSSGSSGPQPAISEERVVTLRPRAIVVALGIILGVAAVLGFVLLAQTGLTLIAIALFLALALNPAVEFFQHRGLSRRLAVAAVYVLAVIGFALLALVFVPPLVTQITHFIDALPGLVHDLTKGRGPLGFLERRYHVVEMVRRATSKPSSGGLTGVATPVLGIAKGVVTTVGGIVIIGFLTLFMLLEGPEWRRRITGLIPERHRPSTERIGAGVYKSVSGFVTGNLLASFLAGVVATVILLIVGVPYALPLGLFTVLIELIPYLGPAVVTVLLSLVALTTGVVAAIVVFALMLLYHVIEGHTLRPLIYGRALKLSALAVLIAIILGTEIAGILGALAAIPVAGSIQVIISELLDQRSPLRRPRTPAEAEPT
ncbi:MAG: AI-2E family transporter [Actinomycetota bacterium]|nr:AI-2E family transporter [Actinomycetota bacterium]